MIYKATMRTTKGWKYGRLEVGLMIVFMAGLLFLDKCIVRFWSIGFIRYIAFHFHV